MKTCHLFVALTVPFFALNDPCTNGEQDQPTTPVTQSTIATTRELTSLESWAPATKTSSAKLTGSTQANPTRQNYTFSSDQDNLQIKGSENQYDILLPTDVLFNFDQSTLRTEGLSLLEKVKQHFVTHGVDQLHVWGHTDSKGNDQYNFKLSQRRAITVANWLKKNIKTKGLIMALGRGEQEPLVPNTNPDGTDNAENRQKNRRVTLSVVKYPNVNKMLNKPKKTAG